MKLLTKLNESNIDRNSILFVLIFTCVSISLYRKWDNKGIIEWDKASYYAYLPAAFIYGDVTLENPNENYEKYKPNIWATPTGVGGKKVIKTTMGVAYAYAPFFAMAHWHAGHFRHTKDGFSKPYQLWIAWSGVFFLILGLIYSRKLLAIYFDRTVIALGVIAISLATNLFFYTSINPGMSHVYLFGIGAVLLYLVDSWWRNPNVLISVIIGALFGWMVLIRPTMILVFPVILFWGMDFSEIKNHPLLKKENIKLIISFALAAFVVWLPQLIYWKSVSGDFLYYSYGSDEKFFFNDPQILNYLYSYRNGWLRYLPVFLFSILGLGLMFKYFKTKAIVIVFLLVSYVYVSSSWWVWWFGGSFAGRGMIEIYPFLIFPMCLTFSFFIEKMKYIGLAVSFLSVFILSYITLFQSDQAANCIIHFDAMSEKAYKYIYLKENNELDMEHLRTLYKHPDYEKAKEGKRSFEESTK